MSLSSELQKQIKLKYNIVLETTPEGHFIAPISLDEHVRKEIGLFVEAFTSGFIFAGAVVAENPQHAYKELRFKIAHALNDRPDSPLFGRLSPAQVTTLAYNMRTLVGVYETNGTLYSVLRDVFSSLSSHIKVDNWDIYLGKHNGFKALLEELPFWHNRDLTSMLTKLPFEQTIVASQSLFHTAKLRRLLKKITA
jgi:hypothetical protein